MKQKPVIGYTGYVLDGISAEFGARFIDAPYLAAGSGNIVVGGDDYAESLRRAGAIPFLIPPTTDLSSISDILGRLDALLLTGGSDLDPSYYGEARSPHLGETIPRRDLFEWQLAAGAIVRGLPVGGICRGMQLLNVVCGGTLVQDMASEIGRKHPSSHKVTLTPGSALFEAFGGRDEMDVNSYHHQIVRRLGVGLTATVHSHDDGIEGLESKNGRLFGVQFHPEMLLKDATPLGFFRRLAELAA